MKPEVHPLAASFSIREVVDPAPPSKQVLAEIDSIWQRESLGARPKLHDGQIFNLTSYRDGAFEGCFVPFRRWLAQRSEPSLRSRLALRPLAVCALTICEERLIFGRRSDQVLQDPGVWELAPAGGLSGESRNLEGQVDPALQLLIELDEELAIKADQVEHMEAFALIDDKQEGVCEIAFRLELAPGSRCRQGGRGEYGEVAMVPEDELSTFLRLVSKTCESSLALLEYAAAIGG